MSDSLLVQRPAKGKIVISWIIQSLLAAVFLAAGCAKLAGVPMMVEIFDQIGIGQWFRIVTALVEIGGAIALLVPGLAAFAALWLGVTMLCASLTHILILHNNPAPALVLLGLNAVLFWLRFGQIAALRDRLR
jgi:uncharacterized membrane protein YphA (DoxX/SURF4 family)